MFRHRFQSFFHCGSFLIPVLLIGGCAVEAAKEPGKTQNEPPPFYTVTAEKSRSQPSRIDIEPASPADAIRLFYKNLREKRFREALFLTNLRPAIEGLTAAELEDLRVDFANLARSVPADIQINGEIISGDTATVTANLPDDETAKMEIKEFQLTREAGGWLILLVDGETEAAVKREGKNYFFALRIDVHHAEAQAMLERIVKAQMVYALQNGGLYGEMKTLIDSGFLPADILSADSTGYNYRVRLSGDKRKYAAAADPAVYGKTGRLSFLLAGGSDEKNPRLKSADNGGKPLEN